MTIVTVQGSLRGVTAYIILKLSGEKRERKQTIFRKSQTLRTSCDMYIVSFSWAWVFTYSLFLRMTLSL